MRWRLVGIGLGLAAILAALASVHILLVVFALAVGAGLLPVVAVWLSVTRHQPAAEF